MDGWLAKSVESHREKTFLHVYAKKQSVDESLKVVVAAFKHN